jgi:hypothetical protein
MLGGDLSCGIEEFAALLTAADMLWVLIFIRRLKNANLRLPICGR